MTAGEVETFEGVGGTLTGLVRLWKCVEKSEESKLTAKLAKKCADSSAQIGHTVLGFCH